MKLNVDNSVPPEVRVLRNRIDSSEDAIDILLASDADNPSSPLNKVLLFEQFELYEDTTALEKALEKLR